MSTPKRVFIIHGWDGNPEEGIFPWLKAKLEKRGLVVFNPAMPKPLNPKIEVWVSFLKKQIGATNEDTILFGHSIGAQTTLRYLESLNEGERIGGAIFLAGWVHLTDKAYETEEDIEIGRPWLETPLNWNKIKSHTNKFVDIFSDDDPLVPVTDANIFKEKLGAEVIIEHDKGHFSGSDGIQELPSALEAILKIAEEK